MIDLIAACSIPAVACISLDTICCKPQFLPAFRGTPKQTKPRKLSRNMHNA